MTAYYTATGNPPDQTRGVSGLVRAEFNLIASAFTSASGDINARGQISGQTWTGVHDFIGATVKVPTLPYGTSGDYAVSWDSLNAAIFSTLGLPGQTGKSGYALFTNGTNPYWALVAGAGGANVTGNITLTAASPAAMTVTPSSAGQYATLPDSTTCIKTTTVFSFYNAGDYDYGVKDASGKVLGWVEPRTGASVGLSDNSTAAGAWTQSGFARIGISGILYAAGLSSNTVRALKRVPVDSTRDFILLGSNNDYCYGVMYDNSTATWGAVTLIRAANSMVDCILSAANQILVVSCNGTALEAVTVTCAGTGLTINSGSKATSTLTNAIGAIGKLIQVGTSFVLSYYCGTVTASYIRAFTVSGTTPTIGAENALNSAASNGGDPGILFASGSIVRSVVGTFSTSGLVAVKPFTVSGSVMTAGTEATISGNTSTQWRVRMLGSGNIYIEGRSSGILLAVLAKLTGTAEALTSAAGTSALAGNYSYHDSLLVSANKVAVCYTPSGDPNVYFNILTDTAGVASLGTELTFTAHAAVQDVYAAAMDGTKALFVVKTTARMYRVIVDCSGGSPSIVSVDTTSFAGGADPVPITNYLDGTRGSFALSQGASVIALAYSGQFNDIAITGKYISKPPSKVGRMFYLSGFSCLDASGAGLTTTQSCSATSIQLIHIEMAA